MGDQAKSSEGQGEAKAFTPPASQADLDRIIADRVSRERAKFADYADLKAKADKFDQAEDAAKSELQKLTDRASQAEQALAQVRAEQAAERLRAEVAAAKGVPVGLLHGSDREALEAHADSLVAFRGDESKSGGQLAPYVPGEGQGGDVKGSPADVFADFRDTHFTK